MRRSMLLSPQVRPILWRGAHFRSDFPEPGDLATSWFTVARQTASGVEISEQPVEFTHVRPGETLLSDQEAAE